MWFYELPLATKRITPCERVLKTVSENGVCSCVPFCFGPLGRFERCGSSLVTCQIYCLIRFTSQRLPNFWSSRCRTTSRPWRSRFKSAHRPRRSATKKSTRMKGKLKSSDKNFKRDASAWAFHFHLIQTIKVNFATHIAYVTMLVESLDVWLKESGQKAEKEVHVAAIFPIFWHLSQKKSYGKFWS